MSLKIALKRIKEVQKSNALELDLSELELREITKEISKLIQLTKLNFSLNN
jgi:Leucine-rich repeat (LRR) protein